MVFFERLPIGLLKTLRTGSAIATAAIIVGFGTVGYNIGPHWYWPMLTAPLFLGSYLTLRGTVFRVVAQRQARQRWAMPGGDVKRVTYSVFGRLRDEYARANIDRECGYIDDRTWADLGMAAIHAEMDGCFTIAGRNELALLLRHGNPRPAEYRSRLELVRRLRHDEAVRERVAAILSLVGEESDADPARFFRSQSSDGRPGADERFRLLFIVMTVAACAAPVVAVAYDLAAGLLAAAVVFVANMVIYFQKARSMSMFIPALRVLSRMLVAAGALSNSGIGADGYDLQRLTATREATRRIRGALRWLLVGAPSPSPSVSGDLIEMLLLYIKIYFLVDLHAYATIVRSVRRHLGRFVDLYRSIGEVDACLALASYRAFRRKTVDTAVLARPAVAPNQAPAAGAIVADDLHHPLVAKAVANSVNIEFPGAIITGTNMAGKSTFLRTIGINLLLSQTAGFAFASRFASCPFRVMSSIEKGDDLAGGRSFYFDEAERIFRMIETIDGAVPLLLLIDELLSGTNSLERESASIAILNFLAGRGALTVAATHDISVAQGLQNRYQLFYFTDKADDSGLSFDYRIKPGIVRTRNAIKLLRLIGYPEDVIRAALTATGVPPGVDETAEPTDFPAGE